MSLWFSCIVSYLLGSIPFGLIITRAVKNIDIREYGSKNIGATNVFRVVGKKWGVLVFIMDVLKGFLAVIVGIFFLKYNPTIPHKIFFGILAILGHSFPIWLGFKGGKGVATSLGVFLSICLVPTLFSFGIWIIALLITRYVSMASLSAAVVFPLAVSLTQYEAPGFSLLLSVSVFLTLFIFYTHRHNIRRLKNGTEDKTF